MIVSSFGRYAVTTAHDHGVGARRGRGGADLSRGLTHTETWAGSRAFAHDAGQVVPDRVTVYGVLQAGRERGHRPVCVIPGPVEPPVHGALDAVAQRVEQRPRPPASTAATATGARRGTRVASSTSPAYTPTSSPVTIAYATVREMIRSIHTAGTSAPPRCTPAECRPPASGPARSTAGPDPAVGAVDGPGHQQQPEPSSGDQADVAQPAICCGAQRPASRSRTEHRATPALRPDRRDRDRRVEAPNQPYRARFPAGLDSWHRRARTPPSPPWMDVRPHLLTTERCVTVTAHPASARRQPPVRNSRPENSRNRQYRQP